MSNGTNPTPLNSEEYGAMVGALLAQQAGQGMFGNPQAERAGVSPFRTLGKYDEGATAALYQPVHNADPETIQEYYRGSNQSALQRMGNAALAFIPGVALKTVQGIGHVGGAVASLLPNSDITGYDNAWVNAIASLDEDLRKALPIHLQQSYGEGNLIKKLGTSTFWTKDFADGVEFLTSAMIPTAGFSKVGSVAKALSNTQRGAKLGKVLADITKKTGINTSAALATTYNTVSEAYFEGKDARDQIREAAARQSGVRHFEDLPEDIREIVDQQAAEAAARVFNANVVALAIPNFFETKWAQSIIGKADNAAESLVRRQILSGEKKAENIAAGIKLRKAFFKGMLSEGLWEENIQASIQQYEQRLSSGELDPNSTSIAEQYAYGLFNNAWGFARFLPDLLTFGAAGTSAKAGSLQDEGATSVFLGSALGGGMSTYAAVKENQALKKYAANVETSWGKLMTYKELTDKHLVDNINSIYKSFGTIEKDDGTTIPNFINPKTGEKEYDIDVLMRRLISDYRNVAYFNEGSMADAADDPVWQRYNLDMSLASWVYRLRNATDHEGFKEILQYKAEIAENAEDGNVIAQNKDKLLAFSQAYDRAVASTQGLDEFIGPEYTKDFNAIYKRLNYFADMKDVMLQDLATSNPNLAQLEDLIQDNNELKDTLKKNKKQLRDDYLQAVKPMYELEKQVKDLHKDLLQATDVQTQEEVGKKLAVAEYQYQEKRAEEGWLPEPTMSDAYTADLRTGVEARTVYNPNKAQNPGVYPYRRNRQYDIGKEALVRTKLASDLDSIQKIDRTFVPDYFSRMGQPDTDLNANLAQLQEKNNIKLQIIRDALGSADLNKGFVGTSKAELTGIQQELEKIIAGLRTTTAKIGSELADALLGKATRPMSEIQQEHESFKQALQEAEDTLLPQVDQLLTVEPTGAKYQKAPRVDNMVDQAKYDFFKSTTPEFESARDIVENPNNLDNFSSEQKLEALRTQIDTTEVVFTNRDDISDQLQARVLKELEQAKKDLAKLEAAFQKNVKSRALIQERASQEAGIQYGSIANNPEIKLILEQIFAENAKNLPTELNAGTVAGIMAALDSAATPNQKKELEKALTRIQDSLYDKVKDLGIDKVQLDRLKSSHSKYIPWTTYDTMLPREIGMSTQNLPYIQLFIETKDVQTFFRDLEDNNYEGIPEETKANLQAWKEIATQLYGLDIFFDTLKSDVNLIEAFNAEKKQYEDSTEGRKAEEVISPTIQQILAIRKAIKFLTTPISKGGNDHLIFIEGLAGTGKTKVVVGNIIRLYNKLTGSTLDSVYTISHTPKSSQILHEQVKQEGSPTTAQDFLAKQDISDLKILVIDEAPAFELVEIRKVLQKVKDYNQNVPAKNRIKILALGDPAQVTQQAYPFITQPALIGMQYTAPLTAIYRTNVGPIIDYFTNYRLNVQPVRDVKATANVPLSALPTTKNLVGVTGSSQAELLKQTAFRDAATTKLIIVEDENAVAQYKADAIAANAQNVEVVPYYKVGGMQVDEVYIDIRPSIFSRPIDYNRAIFTAASRAMKFVYHNTSVITPRVNESLKAQTAESAKDILENGETYSQSLDDTTNTINSLLGVKAVDKPKPPRKAPDPKKPVNTAVDEKLQENSEVGLTDPITPEQITTNDGGTIIPPPPRREAGIKKGAAYHALQYVTNAALAVDSEGNFPNFTGNVRIVSIIPSRGGTTKLSVWAEVLHNDRTKWREIGILGDKDFKGQTGAALLKAVDGYGNKAMSDTTYRERGGYIQPTNQASFEKATVLEAKLEDWAPITYVYSQDPNAAEFNSPLDAAMTAFFNGPGEPFKSKFVKSNGTINWSALNPYAKVGIFKTKPGDPSDIFTKDAAIQAGNFVPEVGIPYLVLNFNKGDFATKTLGHGMGQQYIRLQNKGLSREHPHFQALQDYYSDYQAFKQLTGIEMGTEAYSVAISEAAAILTATKNEQGIPTLDFNPLLDTETHVEQMKEVGVPKEAYNLAIKLAKHIYGPEYKRVKFLSRQEAEEFISNSVEGKYIIDPNYKDGSGRFAILESKGDNAYEIYNDWQVDTHSGPASKAISAISRANPMVGGQQIRVTKTYLGRTITTGKSLITSKTTSPEFRSRFKILYNEIKEEMNEILRQRGYPKLLDPLSYGESIEPWIEYLITLHEQFGVGIPRAEWDRLRTGYSAVSPINETVVEAIINFEGDNNTGVRTPILRKAPDSAENKTGLNDYGDSLNIDINRKEIEKQVHSNLQSVHGSYATISFKADIQQQTPPPEQTSTRTNLKDIERQINIPQRLQQILDALPDYSNIKVEIDPTLAGAGRAGFKAREFERQRTEGRLSPYLKYASIPSAEVYVHEILHYFTIPALKMYESGSRGEQINDYAGTVIRLYNEALSKGYTSKNGVSIHENIVEFAVNITNQTSVEQLKALGIYDELYNATIKYLSSFKISMPEQTSSQPESNTITLLEANKERLKKLNADKKIQELTNLGIIVPKEGKTFLYPGKERIGFIVNIDGAEIPYYQSSNKTSGKTSWWNPYFGNTGAWLVKGTIEGINSGYGIPPIKRMNELLEEILGNKIEAEHSVLKVIRPVLGLATVANAVGKAQDKGITNVLENIKDKDVAKAVGYLQHSEIPAVTIIQTALDNVHMSFKNSNKIIRAALEIPQEMQTPTEAGEKGGTKFIATVLAKIVSKIKKVEYVVASKPAVPEVAPVVTAKFMQLSPQEMVNKLEGARNVLSTAAKDDLDFAKEALKSQLSEEDIAAVKELLIGVYANFTNDRGINMELEAPDTLTLITPDQAWSIARSIVPGIPVDVKEDNIGIRLTARFLLQKYAAPNNVVVGRTLEIGQILLGTESGKVYEEALLHELLHYVYRNLMSAPERRKFTLSAERRLGKGVTEDAIANYWVEWFKTGQRPSSSFMDRVLQAINWFLDLVVPYRKELEDYFKDIAAGKYNQERYRPWTGEGNNMSFIIDNFGDIDSYRHARDFILYRLKKYKKEGVDGLPVTDEYAYKQVHADATQRVRELNQSIDEMEEQVETISPYYDFTTETPNSELGKLSLRQGIEVRKIFNNVYKKALPEAKKERNALDKALGYNNKTRRPIFFEIVTSEFTNWNVISEQELIKRIQLSELEDELIKAQAITDLSQTALKEQIEENENVDPHSRMSDSVKLLLSSITYEDEAAGITKRVSPGFAFLKMLQNFMELEFSSYTKNGETVDVGEAVLEQLDDMLKNRMYSPAEEELVYTLIDLVERAYYPSRTSNYNPADVNIVAEQKPGARHANYHLVYYDTAESILEGQARVALNEISTLDQARDLQRQNSTLKVVPLPANNIDLSYLYKSALEAGAPLDTLRPKEDTDAAREAFKDLYDRLEAKNSLAEMYSLFGSQKETNLMIAQVERKFGDLNIKYISARDLGIRVNIKRELGIRLAELHEGLIEKDSKNYPNGLKDYIKQDGQQLIKDLKATRSGARLSAIETFFTQLGLAAYIPTIPPSEVPDVAKTIEELLSSFNELGTKYEVAATEEDGDIIEGETQIEEVTFEDVLSKQNARLNDLSRLLSKGTELTRASSVKDAEGKPIYKYNNSHYQYDIFNLLHRINDNTFFKGGHKVRRYLSKFLPEFIKTEYFQNNIFSQGLNQIYSPVGYHDAITQLDSGYTTPLQQENVYDRYTREFSAGFLSQMINSNGEYYRQFFYPPSHRSKVLNVQLGILTPSQVKEGIKSAIKQFRLSHNDFKDIKNFKALDFTNFSILENVLNDPELNLTLDSDIDILTDYVYQELLFVADEVTDHIITNKVGLPTNIGFALEIAKKKGFIDTEALTTFEQGVKLSLPREFKTRKYNPKTQETDYLASKEELLPMVHAFVMNNYINGYFANQLILGDNRFYKGGDDIVKRNAGPSAAGQIGLIGNLTDVPEKYTLAVLNDDTISFDNIKEFLEQFITDEKERAEIIGYFAEENVDITDAQGFMTPNRWRQVQRMYGRSYGLGHVMKPIHYEQTTTWVRTTELEDKSEADVKKLLELPYYRENADGLIEKLITHPIYVKYSSVNLSNELVERFPTLALLRQRMEFAGMDELTFVSAIKVGAPKNTASLKDFLAGDTTNVKTYQLSNRNYRMQLNPYSDTDTYVTIYSQLMYFLNILGKNNPQADTVYKIVSALIELGITEAEELLSTTDAQPNAVKNFILKSLRSKDSQRARELLEANISINNPVIEQKAITAIASGIEKLTTKIKFKGSKVVLQSSYGLAKYGNIDKIDRRTIEKGERLQYRVDPKTKTLYAEVIFPAKYLTDSQKAAIKRGESLFAVEDIFGFRIPSTELHSAVPLRIVDYYDDLGTNVIVAPAELVPLHGSDFDVDSLFIIERERAQQEYNLPDIGNIKGVYFSEGTYIGYKKKSPKSNQLVINDDVLVKLDGYISAAQTKLKTLSGKAKRKERGIYQKALSDAKSLRKMFLRNKITDTMLEVITAERNRSRMLTPISMKELTQEAERFDTKTNLDLNHPIQRYRAFELLQDGQLLVGEFANDVKSLSYMVRAGEDGAKPLLRERDHISIRIDNTDHDFKQLAEYDIDGKQTWQRLDAAINAAIDNAKVLILPRLGVTQRTGKAFAGLLSVGIPLRVVTDLINSSTIKQLQGPDSRRKIADEIHEVKKRLADAYKTRAKEGEEIELAYTTLDASKINSELNLSDLSALSREDIQLAYNILTTYERGHNVGTSLQSMSKFLSIVREFPTTAEGIEEIYNAYGQIFNKNENLEKTLSVPDSLQLRRGVPQYIDPKAATLGDTSLEMNEGFSFQIEKFFAVNPHIFSTWKAFLKLRNLVRNNFVLHSEVADKLITALGVTSELRLDKGMPDSSGPKNRVLHKRELSKYILSQTYATQLDSETPYTYTNKYGKERILRRGSAFSQHFAKKIIALKKWNKQQIVDDPTYKGNTFLQNLSVVKSAGVNLWTIRFSKGTSVTQEEIEELQADFENLRTLTVENGKVRRLLPSEIPLSGEFTQLQKDFVKYSVVNYGFKFSAANYAYFLPPSIYREIDNAFASKWKDLIEDGGEKVKDHFAISMIAHHRDKLNWIPSYKAEKVPNGSQVIELGFGETKVENNYAGVDTDEGGFIFYDRKYPVGKHELPDYYKEGNGWQATAFKKVHTAKIGDNTYAYYQRIARPADNVYQTLPSLLEKDLQYDLDIAYDPRSLTVQVDDTSTRTIHLPYDVSNAVGEVIQLIDRNDYTRMDSVPVRIKKVEKVEDDWKVTLESIDLPSLKFDTQGTSARLGDFYDVSNSTTVKEILLRPEVAKSFRYSPVVKLMADRLTEFSAIGDIPVYTGVFANSNLKGLYSYNKQRGTAIRLSRQDSDLETAIHEITHAYTSGIARIGNQILSDLGYNFSYWELEELVDLNTPIDLYKLDRLIQKEGDRFGLTEAERKFLQDIIVAYDIAVREIFRSGDYHVYGITNLSEFLAEAVSNPEFRNRLHKIKLSTVKNVSTWQNLWQVIQSALRRLFKALGKNLSTAERNVINNFSLETVVDQLLTDFLETRPNRPIENDFFQSYSLASIDEFSQRSEEFKEAVDPVTQKSVYEKDGKFFTRVSDILDIFKNRNNNEPWYEYVAKKVWGNKSSETVLDTDEGRMNQEEYAKVLQEKDTKGKMRGKIIHAMIQQFLHPDQMAEIQTKINGYMREGDYEPYQFTWVQEAMSDILISTKVNIFDDIPEDQRDQILSEVTVGDDLLALAGTIDMLVKHADGKYSIIDFKTGFGFRKPSPVFAKYFNAPGRAITASQQDMAGLQIALYAFLLKLNNPDIKFRDLRVRWIPSQHHVKSVPHLENVDIENYLPVIKQFLSREPAYKQVWEDLQKRDDFAELFSASTYIDGYSPRVIADIEKGGYSPEQQAELYLQKLKELVQYKIVSIDEDKKHIDDNIIELTKNITELLGDAGISYEAVKEGSSIFDEWIGNMYDSTDPYIQLAVRFYEERKQRADIRYDIAYKGFLARMTPVYQSYQKRNKYAVLDKLPIVKGALNFTNYEKLYDPMYKILPDGGVEWNTTEKDWQDAVVRYKQETGHTLTEQEIKEYKNLLSYIQDQYAQFFLDERSQYKNPEGKAVALWNRIATTRMINNKEHFVTNGELFNGQTAGGKSFSPHARSIPFSYDPKTMVPVVPITGEEVHRRNGFLSKEYADYLKERYGSMYVEQYFEQWYNDEMALPFKYLPNERILADKSFSVNVELQFDKFMRAMIYKEELDDVYALYKGLQYSLEAKDAAAGMPAFAGTAELLKYNSEMQVRGRTQRQFKSKLFRRGGNRDWVKILGTFQKVVSAPIMWLKPITGTANGVFTYMYTVKEAIKGSVIQKMDSIENHAADFSVADIAWATAQYFDMQLDAMKGNLRNNKMFLFLKRLGYLPDTYKWATDRNQLLTMRNKAISSSAMYMFHTLPEEAVASIIMAAQLRSMKISKDHSTHPNISLWDMYKPQEFKNTDGTTYTDLVWEKDKDGKPVVRGYINTSKDPKNPSYKELTELSSREVQRMRYVYQRMHGGYRQDERVKLEYFIMGRLFLQFKKYLPTILRNIGQSKGLSDSLGYYKELEKKDGVSVLEWQQEMIEGRWRVLLKTASNFLGVKAQFDTPTNSWQRAINTIVPNKNEDYSWKELSAQQKAALVDGVVSAATMGILIAGYTRIFGIGAGDSDDSWAKIIDRIINDYTQQYNPLELMKNTINNLAPVSGRKLYKTADSLWTFVWAAMFNDVTASGDIRGWAELRRSIPFLSSYRDIIYFLENREQANLTDYIFTKGIN